MKCVGCYAKLVVSQTYSCSGLPVVLVFAFLGSFLVSLLKLWGWFPRVSSLWVWHKALVLLGGAATVVALCSQGCNHPCKAPSSPLRGDGNALSWDVPGCLTIAMPASGSPATHPASLVSLLAVTCRNERWEVQSLWEGKGTLLLLDRTQISVLFSLEKCEALVKQTLCARHPMLSKSTWPDLPFCYTEHKTYAFFQQFQY